MKKIVLTVATLSLVFGAVALAATWARSLFHSSGVSAAVVQQNQRSSSPQVRTFTGTISKESGQYVLQGEVEEAPYLLDDQQTASKFAGEKVTVTGTLDAASNLIRVQSIQASAF